MVFHTRLSNSAVCHPRVGGHVALGELDGSGTWLGKPAGSRGDAGEFG